MRVRVADSFLESLIWDPETTEEEVAQNVVALALTPKGSVPLERGMGMPMEYFHRPMPAASAMFETELIGQLDAHENRAILTGANYDSYHKTGQMIADLEVEIHG